MRLRRLPRLVIAVLAAAFIMHVGFSQGDYHGDGGEALTVVSLVDPPLTFKGSDLDIESPSAILVDAVSGQVLYEKNSRDRRAPASVTKLMTMALVLDALKASQISLDDDVTASMHATSFGGTQIYLEPGEVMKLEDMLYALAVFSANDAAVALAEHVAGSEQAFVDLMNEKAKALGMKDSHFSNPHGLPGFGTHYTSARDLAILSVYLVNEHPESLKYTKTWEHWVRKGQKNEVWLTNHNRGLMEYKGMDGLKTGWTNEAGYCLAATAKKDDRRLVAVVLGATNPKERQSEIYRLLDYGFGGFETIKVADGNEVVGKATVLEGLAEEVEVGPADTVAVTVPKGEKGTISRQVEYERRLQAPIRAGQVMGSLVVTKDKKEIRRVPLVARAEIPRAGVATLLWRYWKNMWMPSY